MSNPKKWLEFPHDVEAIPINYSSQHIYILKYSEVIVLYIPNKS